MYDIIPVDTTKEGISQCCTLLNTAFPQGVQFTDDFLEWQYNQNPAGPVMGFNAFDRQQLVAHYVTIPLVAQLFGKQSRGLLSLNTATHPTHQGKRLFRTLANQTYGKAAEAGYEFIIGVANAASTPGFYKMGFQQVSQLDARIGFGSRAPHTCSQLDFEPIWDMERLKWRFQNPNGIYRFVKEGRIIRMLASTGKFGIQAILAEFDPDKYQQQLFPQLSSNFCPLKLWIGLDCRKDWSRTLYINVPDRLRPSPLNLIFKDLTGENRTLSAKRISFHAIDFDPY